MRPLHCLTLSLLLMGQPASAQDLLKPPAQAEPPEINGGPATDIVSEPVIHARGTLEAIDRERGQVRIAHEAVPTLEWPAASMTFEARLEQLEGLAVGDRVRIGFQEEDGRAALVFIERR